VATDKYLFTGTEKGVYISVNNGSNWRAINEGIENVTEINDLGISGNYLLASTDKGVFRRSISDFATLGIKENADMNCSISPNPMSNQLTINCANELIGQQYAIQNILGETIFTNTLTNNNTVVSLNNAPNGVYFLHIIGTSKTIKFVKQ
jgi:hypothetical protein